MRLIDKYILRSFLLPLFYFIAILISLYIIIDLFGHLDEIIKEGVGIKMLLIYYLSYAPSITIQIMPIVILMSTMYMLGSFRKHNEITALRSSGIGLWGILNPILKVSFIIAAIALIANDSIVPKTTQIYLKIKEEKLERKKPSRAGAKIFKDVALYGQDNKIIYARSFDPKANVLKGIIIHEHDRRQNIISKTLARDARWTANGWVAFNITVYELDREGQIIGEPDFKRRGKLDIREGPRDFQKQTYSAEVLTISELGDYIKKLSLTGGPALRNVVIERYNRISYPFANIVVVLIGAAFCLRVKRSSRLLGVGVGFLVGLLFYSINAISIALGKSGVLAPFISTWLSNAVFSIWGIYLINKY